VLGAELVRVADHAEQALGLGHAVDGELGVENLVAAVLAVGLREHHQLHIGGVAFEARERRDQIIDFVFGQGQAPGLVGVFQSSATANQHIHMRHGRRVQRSEQGRSLIPAGHRGLGHAVVQQGSDLAQLISRQFGGAEQAGFQGQAVFGQALHAAHVKTAVVGNVGRLGRPGRDRADARADHDHRAIDRTCVGLAIGQQCGQGVLLGIAHGRCRGHQVHKTGGNAQNLRRYFCQTWQNLGNAKVAEGAGAFESRDVQGHGVAL
jgi:hypothetical protein